MKRISPSATSTAACLFMSVILISSGGKEYGGLLRTVSASATASASTTEHFDATDVTKSIINRYIVKFKNTTDTEFDINYRSGSETKFHTQSTSRTELHYRLSRDDPHLIMTLPETLVDTAEVMTIDTEEDLWYWQNHEDVEYVEQDSKVYPHQSLPLQSVSLSSGESTPWGIKRVKALDVNDDNVYNQRVCIIDTGYDVSHPDLPSTVTGKSQVDSESWKKDGAGHGTHVAGTIAAIGGNNEGVVGVNRNGQIKLHIVKVFNNNGSWTWGSDLIKAVASCVDAGSTVVNMSLGGGAATNTEKEAYEKAYKQDGVLLVASAGNSGNTNKSYPASYPAVFSVGATDVNNQRASFSQYNNQVDICAPGVAVESTVPGGRYSKYDGTSMSSPHVAGVAALVWSHFPNKNAQQIRQALESSAKDLGAAGRDNEYGHGLIQADDAYNFLLSGGGGGGGRPAPAPVPAPTPNSKCTNSPIDWHDSDGSNFNCGWYAQQGRCAKYGDNFPNRNKTANQACCACGGGQTSESTKAPVPAPVAPPIQPPFQPTEAPVPAPVRPTEAPVPAPIPAPVRPTEAPVPAPVQPPVTAPTPVSECIDSPIDWHDSDGSNFNCGWYAQQDRCAKYGDNFPNRNKTANQACCACGGGETSGSTTAPIPAPVRPTEAPAPAPLQPPVTAPTPVSECTDSPIDWHDSDGSEFNCEWYAKRERCSKYGNDFTNKGKTANQACCACGGGETSGNPPPIPAPTPSDTTMCGCSSCTTEILNREVRPGLTVLSHINWLIENAYSTEIEACELTCSRVFKETCGLECDPTTCNN